MFIGCTRLAGSDYPVDTKFLTLSPTDQEKNMNHQGPQIPEDVNDSNHYRAYRLLLSVCETGVLSRACDPKNKENLTRSVKQSSKS